MLYAYTAVISESDGIFYAKVPDVSGCITTASSLPEAISPITDALNLCLVGLEDEGIKPILSSIAAQPIPAPSGRTSLSPPGWLPLLISAASTVPRFCRMLFP